MTEGGRLIFDLFNPSLEALVRTVDQEIAEDGEFSTADGRRVTRSFKIVAHDRFRQVNDVQLIYDVVHPNGRNERLVQAFAMRYLFRFEAEHLLARAGFVIEHLYAGYDMSEYGTTYPGELVFVATRTTTPATR